MFRVNLYRRQIVEGQEDYGNAFIKHGQSIGEASEKHREQFGTDLNDTQIRILELLSLDVRLSAKKMARQLGVASRNVEANIKKLKSGFVVGFYRSEEKADKNQ